MVTNGKQQEATYQLASGHNISTKPQNLHNSETNHLCQPRNNYKKFRKKKKCKCFNNKEKKNNCVIHLDITPVNWTAAKCPKLTVAQNTTNLLGKDLLPKLTINLQQTEQAKQGTKRNAITYIDSVKNIIIWILKNTHTYAHV